MPRFRIPGACFVCEETIVINEKTPRLAGKVMHKECAEFQERTRKLHGRWLDKNRAIGWDHVTWMRHLVRGCRSCGIKPFGFTQYLARPQFVVMPEWDRPLCKGCWKTEWHKAEKAKEATSSPSSPTTDPPPAETEPTQ